MDLCRHGVPHERACKECERAGDRAHGLCEDCGDLRWCCTASRERVEKRIRELEEQLAEFIACAEEKE